MTLQFTRFEPGDTAYFIETFDGLSLVEILSKEFVEGGGTLLYKVKNKKTIIKPAYWVKKQEQILGSERTLFGKYDCPTPLFDEEEMKAYFGREDFSSLTLSREEKCSAMSRIFARKREEYLKSKEPDAYFSALTHSGKKIAEIGEDFYREGEIQDQIRVIGSLPIGEFPEAFPEYAFDYHCRKGIQPDLLLLLLREAVPQIKEGNRLFGFEADFRFDNFPPNEGIHSWPNCYVGTPLVKVITEKRGNLSGFPVEDIVQHLYQKLEEQTNGGKIK